MTFMYQESQLELKLLHSKLQESQKGLPRSSKSGQQTHSSVRDQAAAAEVRGEMLRITHVIQRWQRSSKRKGVSCLPMQGVPLRLPLKLPQWRYLEERSLGHLAGRAPVEFGLIVPVTFCTRACSCGCSSLGGSAVNSHSGMGPPQQTPADWWSLWALEAAANTSM